MWRSQRKYRLPGLEELMAEAVRMVDGRAADSYEHVERVPAWVAVNALAHSHGEQLAAIADGRYQVHCGAWHIAVPGLAAEILECVGTEAELQALQRDVLIPLELDLLDAPEQSPKSPRELAALVVGALIDRQIHWDH